MSGDPSFLAYQRHPVVDQSILHFHREGRQNVLDLLLVLNLIPEFGLNDMPLDTSWKKIISLKSGPGFST